MPLCFSNLAFQLTNPALLNLSLSCLLAGLLGPPCFYRLSCPLAACLAFGWNSLSSPALDLLGLFAPIFLGKDLVDGTDLSLAFSNLFFISQHLLVNGGVIFIYPKLFLVGSRLLVVLGCLPLVLFLEGLELADALFAQLDPLLLHVVSDHSLADPFCFEN